jgi:hypothetical protein
MGDVVTETNRQLRYVVLHHTDIPAPHFDLLFESKIPARALVASRLSEWPPTSSATIERIPDHRRHYLTHEGPVSNDRGSVHRVAQGTCTYEIEGEDSLLLTLDNRIQIIIPRATWD